MCNTSPHSPDHDDLSSLIDDAAYRIDLIRTRLWPVFDFVISHRESHDRVKRDSCDRLFAEVMLVSIRDLRNQVIDVQELLQGAKS